MFNSASASCGDWLGGESDPKHKTNKQKNTKYGYVCMVSRILVQMDVVCVWPWNGIIILLAIWPVPYLSRYCLIRSLSWRLLSTLPGCLTYHELLPTLIVLATLDETCILKTRQKRKKNIKQNKCSVLVLASAQVAVATTTSRHATSFIQKLIVPVGLFRDQKKKEELTT